MPLESGERRPTRFQNTVGPGPGPHPHPPPPPPPPPPLPKPEEQLACPRCQSSNTKFCYYNNYNLSQPRHFCKSCRRYWTQGGTLRNVPIGGGTRKNSKRSRSSHVSSSSSSSSSTTASTSALSTLTHESESLPVSLPTGNSDSAPLANIKADPVYDDLNLNENLPVTEDGNFLSLMNSHPVQGAAGSMGLGIGGYGPGFGFGLCEPGLGFGGRGVWTYPGMNYNASAGNGGAVGSGNMWQQLDDVDGGELVDGDCFAWPGLAISNPGRSLK